MLAPGIALFTFGYALLWTGVQRFRGKDTTLIEALGGTGGSTSKVTDDGTVSSADVSALGSAAAGAATLGGKATNTPQSNKGTSGKIGQNLP